ncbi:hypothetical protein AKJ16_DCAP18594 [Drosera capensis]
MGLGGGLGSGDLSREQVVQGLRYPRDCDRVVPAPLLMFWEGSRGEMTTLIPLGADAPVIKDKAWFWFGRCLAMANLFYFSVNLFAFLIPRFLPKAFERYFEDSRDEFHMKKVEDERSATSASTSESTDKKTNSCEGLIHSQCARMMFPDLL